MRRLLIIGCGDVALRMVPLVRGRYVLYALARDRDRFRWIARTGPETGVGRSRPSGSLAALAGLAHDVVHFAPPPRSGMHDTRTAHLIAALAKAKSLPQHLVYLSTSGVYGDCGGELVDGDASAASTDRARTAPRRCGVASCERGARAAACV